MLHDPSNYHLTILYHANCGPGSSVGIATDYGLDGPEIESLWGRDFPPVQTGPGAHPASCTGSFPGVKCGRGVLLTTHPLLAPRSWKSAAIPLPPHPLWATTGPVTGLLYLFISRQLIRKFWIVYFYPLLCYFEACDANGLPDPVNFRSYTLCFKRRVGAVNLNSFNGSASYRSKTIFCFIT